MGRAAAACRPDIQRLDSTRKESFSLRMGLLAPGKKDSVVAMSWTAFSLAE